MTTLFPAGQLVAREYFQNKILEMFLSPSSICTSHQDRRARGRRCIHEICKSRYIVYRACSETARQQLVDAGHVDAAISRPITNRDHSLGRATNTLAIGLSASELAAAMPRRRCVCRWASSAT
jgi:hypothetical protein